MMVISDHIDDDDPDNPPLFQSNRHNQQGGRSVEEPRLKLDEFPGGHEHPTSTRLGDKLRGF